MIFGVGEFNYASHIWLGHTRIAMATKICDFQHKIGYNLACAAATSTTVTKISKFEYKINVIGLHDSPLPTTIKQQI